MTDKNEKFHGNDDEFDLSDVINEYEEDSELRKKIEQMKKEKEKQEQPTSDVFQTVEADTNVHENDEESVFSGFSENRKSPFLDVDATQEDVGATRVMNVEDDGDKTLVIMDNQRKRVFEQETEEDESIYEYNNHDIEEELTEDDIREYLGDDDTEEPEKPSKKDPKKMNKTVTYVIGAIVGLCIIAAVGFGFKALMDNYGGNSDPAVSDTDKDKDKGKDSDKDKDKDADKDKENTDSNTNNNNNNSNTKDNSVRIAEINGSIKDKQNQIDTLNKQLDVANKELEEAKTGFDKTKYNVLVKNRDDAMELMDQKQKDIDACEAEEGKDCSKLTSEYKELAIAKDGYEAQIKTLDGYQSTITNKPSEITDINKKITDLNNEILKLQNELATLK